MRVVILLLVLLATSASAQSITRAEVAKMSPHDLAVRVLGAAGETGKAREVKLGHGRPAPWIEQVEIDFPQYNLGNLCEADELVVNLAPRDPEAYSKDSDRSYDPPVFATNIEGYYRHFAASDLPNCKAIPDSNYFSAIDSRQALEAIDAFKLFRSAAATKSNVLRCDDPDSRLCPADIFAEITTFDRVISVQNDGNEFTIVLDVKGTPSGARRELWLSSLDDGMKLARAEVRNIEILPVY